MREDIRDIKVKHIVPDPGNLRKSFDAADIEALAENLLEVGQTDPIQVFVREKRDGRTIYDLFDGERRWRAAKLKGIKTLRAIIIPRPTENELLVRRISRMMQTRDYSFQEQVTALETGLKALGVWKKPEKWGNVAPKLGVKPEQLRERMRIVCLSPKLRSQFFHGKLDYTVAQQLGRLDEPRKQEQVANFITQYHLSNRFVTAKFMTTVIEHPESPLIEVYDLARKELADAVYAKTRLGTEIKKSLQQEINEFIDTLMNVEKVLERGARDGFFKEIFASEFERARTIGALVRLRKVVEGFLQAVETRFGRDYDKVLSQAERKSLPVRSDDAD
ncbi:ParB N-terminal domain-containing protein [Acidobacteriia bacterium AH_259_A11_L15]|nr:ParB N-terminal domain-containing protein [Acidobacteriia bacterium AH_259_A11_L15]